MNGSAHSRKVLVLGGTGFVGRRATPLFVEHGWDVTCLVRSDESASVVTSMGATPLLGNLDDSENLGAVFAASGCNILVCIASMGFGHAPAIVNAAKSAGITRAVFVSTTAIFTSLNAPSKKVRVAAEDTVTSSGLDFTILRPTMIYGAHDDRNIARLIVALERFPIFPVPGGGHRLQQPIHVEDVAEAILGAVESDATIGYSFNIAGPEALTFRQLVSTIVSVLGKRRLIVSIPLAPVIRTVAMYERFARRPRIKAEQFERLGEDKEFDNGPARETFGFTSRSFATGITEEIADIARRRTAATGTSRA